MNSDLDRVDEILQEYPPDGEEIPPTEVIRELIDILSAFTLEEES